MHPDRPHQRLAIAIVVAFLALGTLYSVVNPVFESPDEVYHYPYVKHIADGRGLPIQDVNADTLWGQEGSQPPLYYALAALVTSWVDTDDLDTLYRLNPHARIGVPLAQDNKNMIIHSEREAWPWRRTTLAVHIVRLLSLLMGAGTICCTYAITRLALPRSPALAIGAMGINAFIPMFLFVSSSVNNDNLINLLASTSLLLMTWRLRALRQPWWSLPVLGLVIGMACLAKLSGLALLPLAGVALVAERAEVLLANRKSLPDIVRTLAEATVSWLVVALVAACVAGWWYLRNLRLYGDPTGLNVMLAIFGRRTAVPTLAELWGEFRGLRISFWGLFGVVNVLMPPYYIYHVFDGVTIVAAAGLVHRALRISPEERRELAPTLALWGMWIAALCVSLLRWTALTKASQGRLLYPAIAPFSILLCVGVAEWLPRHRRPAYRHFVWVPLLLLSVAAPWTAIAPAYARPRLIAPEDIPSSATPYRATYGEVMRLLAVEVSPEPVSSVGYVDVELYWECLASTPEDLSIYIHLFGRGGEKIGQRDSYPGGGSYPTSRWLPGQTLRDRYQVPVDADAKGPVAAEVEVGMYRLETMQNLPVRDDGGQPVGRPVVARVKIAGHGSAAIPEHHIHANLANKVLLVGYDVDDEPFFPGSSRRFTLYWEPIDAIGQDLTVFLHLVDAEGRIIGQGDGPPLSGEYPTSYWGQGERLADPHDVVVHGDASVGPARVLVGLYDPNTGTRVPTIDPEGRVAGDHVVLTTVHVAR